MDNVFFILSKVFWLFINPENILILAFAITALLFILKKDRLAKKIFYWSSAILFVIALFPIGSWLIYPLETQFSSQPKLPNKVDGIILLGGSFIPSSSQTWNKVQTNRYADRVFSFVSLMQQYPNAKAIFTGGKASIQAMHPSEAFFAKKLFKELGIKKGRVLFDDKARNTYENSLYAKKLAKPKQGENWIVISSAFHLPRSVGVFCQQNWPVIPYPADYHSDPKTFLMPSLSLSGNLDVLNDAIHEWIGLGAYYLTHKTNAWLPKQCY